MLLGAGRATNDAGIDYAAGIYLHKKYGDTVLSGTPIATLYAESEEQLAAGEERFRMAVKIDAQPPAPEKLIYGYVDAEGFHDR